jgi:hypothetical protein
MPFSVMLSRVAVVRTDVSEELGESHHQTRIGEIGTLAMTSYRRTLGRNTRLTASVVPCSPILVTLMMEALSFSEMSVLTGTTRCNIPEDGILHSRRRENLKSYIALTFWTL